MVVKAEYLIDNQGHKKSVVLSLRDYLRLWEYLEDLEDSLDLKKTKDTARKFEDFDRLARRLKRSGKLQ